MSQQSTGSSFELIRGFPAAVTSDRRELLLGLSGVMVALGLGGCDAGPSAESVVGAGAALDGEPLPAELWRAGAQQLAAAIARGEVTSLEVIEAHLARISAVNDQVNAIVAVYADEARAAARRADDAVVAGGRLGPLHGVPFTIKDNLPQAGKPNTDGLEENRDNIALSDAAVVARMRNAGAIPLGRTNLPDMALRVHSFSELWGRTLNPWSAGHNVGGSSGGEAAALATGMTPIGLGNDIGGSLRNPANCCGIVSLKPSFGRVPGTGGGIASQLMAVEGPMARRVADLRLGYEILAGVDVTDPWTMPVPLDLPLPDARRVALVPEPSGGTTEPSVAAAVRQAGVALSAAGYEVEEVEPPRLGDVFGIWMDWLGVELSTGMAFFEEVMSEEAFRFLDLAMQSLRSQGLETYMSAMQRRLALLQEWSAFFDRYPLIVGPVFTQPPFAVGYDVAGKTEAWDVLLQLRLVVAPNLMGLPAVAVPVAIGADGLPRGVQVIGDRFRDGLCLEAAAAIERERGIFTPIDPRENSLASSNV